MIFFNLNLMSNPILFENSEYIISLTPLQSTKTVYVFNDNNFTFKLQQNDDLVNIDNVHLMIEILGHIIRFFTGRATKDIKYDEHYLIFQFIKSKNQFKNFINNEIINKKDPRYSNLIELFNLANCKQTKPVKINSLNIKSSQEFHNLLASYQIGIAEPDLIKPTYTLLLGLESNEIKEMIEKTIELRNDLNKNVKHPENEQDYHKYNSVIFKKLIQTVQQRKLKNCCDNYLLSHKNDIYIDNLLIGLQNFINNDSDALSKIWDQSFKYFKDGKSSTASNNTELTPNYIADFLAMLLKPFINKKCVSCLDCCSGFNGLFKGLFRVYPDIEFNCIGCETVKEYAEISNLDAKFHNQNITINPVDFFTFKPTKMFDINVCNPPYTTKISKYEVLEFVIRSMKMSKVGVYIFPYSALSKKPELLEKLLSFVSIQK